MRGGGKARGEGLEHVDGACRCGGRSRHCVGVDGTHPCVGGCYTTSPPDSHMVVDKKISDPKIVHFLSRQA
jgi:hypothetical protein